MSESNCMEVKNCICGGKGNVKESDGTHMVMCSKCFKAAVRKTKKEAIEQWNRETADIVRAKTPWDGRNESKESLREFILERLKEIHRKSISNSANIDECLFTLGLCYAHLVKEDEDAERFIRSTICNTN